MGMNPDTNRFEQLHADPTQEALRKVTGEYQAKQHLGSLLRPDGSPVPGHWSVFAVDEQVVIKNYTFKVAHIGESHILFEPVGPVVLGEKK